MLNSPILDTVISLVLVYLILCILVSCIQELVAGFFNSRGKALKDALSKILKDKLGKDYTALLYQHPNVGMMGKDEKELPSFLNGRHFAAALMDVLKEEEMAARAASLKSADTGAVADAPANPAPETASLANAAKVTLIDKLRGAMTGIGAGAGGMNMLSAAEEIPQVAQLQKELEDWYDNYMQRVSGWYKRSIRKKILLFSAIVVILLNVNFIDLASAVYGNADMRNRLMPVALSFAAKDSLPGISTELNKLQSQTDSIRRSLTDSLSLPIGWKMKCVEGNLITEIKCFFSSAAQEIGRKGWGHSFWGWLLSIAIMSLGAPFWFDVLKKLVNIRNSGPKPGENSSGKS